MMFALDRLRAALGPRAPRTPYDLGVAALARGEAAAALDHFDRFDASLAGAPASDVARSRNKRGVALLALERPQEALAAFCAALAADERCAPALVNVGSLALEDGHPLDAIDYYRAAIACDAAYGPAYRHLGIALKRVGRRPEAARAFRSAVRCEGKRSARS